MSVVDRILIILCFLCLFVLHLVDASRLKSLEAAMYSAQQPHERNICDTIVKFVAFYPAGTLHVGGGVNKQDTSLTVYYRK